MATPMVAATGALMRHLNPDLDVAEIVRMIKETARRPPSTAWTADLGWGILDAGAAVRAARRIDHVPPASRARAARRVHAGSARIAVRVRVRGRDPAPGALVASGVRRYELWVARAGHPPHRVARTARHTTTVRLAPGRYGLWSIAVDRAGNRERRPRRPDVTLRVSRP
jgi:hypothetical protein